MKQNFCICLILILLSLTSTTVFAHKVRIFAYAEGERIIGETAFHGGKTPRDAEILVLSVTDKTTLLRTRTDESGRFSFAIPKEAQDARLDLSIVVNVGEGHRNSWLLKAEEYLPGGVSQDLRPVTPEVASSDHVIPATAPAPLDEQRIRTIVEESVARQLGPIKHMLTESRDKGPSLQDILGGLGYIIGLAGIAVYMKAKKGGS